MKRSFGIIGGDRRFVELARLLERDGHTVRTFGLPDKAASPADRSGLDAALSAETVILPLPLCGEPGVLNCTASRMPLAELFARLRPGVRVLAGLVPAEAETLAEARGVALTDYFRRESVTVANAAATADAALALVLMETGETLCGRRCLVLGFGRVGNLLCHRLRAAGAEVVTAVRSPEARARAAAYGYGTLDIRTLSGKLGGFPLVWNTVPAPVLDAGLAAELGEDCLYVELASRPGLADGAAEAAGLSVLEARSLPGRLVPVTAARILRNAVYEILAEDEAAQTPSGDADP